MKSTIVGAYPRVGSKSGDALRKALNAPRSARDETLIGQLRQYLTREVVQEMVAAGIDLPNSGLIDVYDELTWPLEKTKGIRFGGMKKTFHTNIHYREPIVEGRVVRTSPFVDGSYVAATEVHPRVKVEFPGPFTLASHSVMDPNAPYRNLRELALAYAQLYREELRGLRNVPLVQFNEPSVIAFGRAHNDIGIVPEVYETMLDGADSPVVVWTFYGNYTKEMLDMLLSLPADIIGLDFVWDPGVAQLLQSRTIDKGIGIGIVDSGDRGYIGLEEVDEVLRTVKNLGNYLPLDKSLLSSNATLEHLSRGDARKKISLIGEVTRRINQ